MAVLFPGKRGKIRIDLVNVRYTSKENGREFTALITATARDYYVDDRTRQKIRGDNSASQFQEFWTFQRFENQWRLSEIEQSRESGALKEENFFEQFTDIGMDQIYGTLASKKGTTGPWLEKKDDFMVRIRAHSQRIMLRNGKVLQQDEDVVPFEQNLSFGRLKVAGMIEKRWRLKEILTKGSVPACIARENLDQDSNLEQLHWYYEHKRAI